ncbi:hemerythrin domain-containing protein [Anaerosacchariphilus polymeriproducens]|uniref:Hemerythrin domain-containing protein n=1 Tax=Anaerosacchariphilus polymeriproducens TaxID=1812858 RepID=A0A371AZD1_9FIRM|nr:hemerythrin domain-containing protein [Anaerosacchariphilus polymeriproducens]RDU24917.1 hemerythrin domain-containing protein [Anaerosacchariphilus polymeriproducens]
MYGIEILKEEHQNILKFNAYLRKLCCKIMEGDEIDVPLFHECIYFVRNYADKHHHGKEEEILFKIMTEQMGEVAQKLIRNGMYVEHDMGRMHITYLENSLAEYEKSPTTENRMNIIVHAVSYGNLLKRHIEKEDSVVYSFAERMLSEEVKNQINLLSLEKDKDTESAAIRDKCLNWLQERLKER